MIEFKNTVWRCECGAERPTTPILDGTGTWGWWQASMRHQCSALKYGHCRIVVVPTKEELDFVAIAVAARLSPAPAPEQPKRRGRPPGSKNKPKVEA